MLAWGWFSGNRLGSEKPREIFLKLSRGPNIPELDLR